MSAGPLWVGVFVTGVAALVTWWLVDNVKKNGLGPTFPTDGVETVRRRLQRDLDAVQWSASVIAYFVATVFDNEHSTFDPAVAFALGVTLTLGGTIILQRTDPDKYNVVCKAGPFTPPVIILFIAYFVALAFT